MEPQLLAAIEILAAATGAPEVFVDHQPAGVSISLSHRDRVAACALAPSGGVVGCDLELVEPRSAAFVSDYFTADEQQSIVQASAEQRDRLATVLWSAKESALKALQVGLRVDTRAVTASIVADPCNAIETEDSRAADEWYPLRARYEQSQEFAGWWRLIGRLVRTVVSVPSADPPTLLATSQPTGAIANGLSSVRSSEFRAR